MTVQLENGVKVEDVEIITCTQEIVIIQRQKEKIPIQKSPFEGTLVV